MRLAILISFSLLASSLSSQNIIEDLFIMQTHIHGASSEDVLFTQMHNQSKLNWWDANAHLSSIRSKSVFISVGVIYNYKENIKWKIFFRPQE